MSYGYSHACNFLRALFCHLCFPILIFREYPQLRAALSAQLAVVVISAILGFVTGIAWPIALLTFLKKHHHNQVSPLDFMDYFDPISHFVKMAPFIAAVVMIGKVGSSECCVMCL
jgi:ABC-type transporter Mla maintaining outer membrane lipid asymmetry permease subunit MlaE